MAASSSPMLSAVLILIISAGAGAGAAETALDQVCVRLGGNYVTPELCKSALCTGQSACRAARDAPAVAALAARLAADNATAARASIEAYARSPPPSPAEAEAVRSCLQLYAGAAPALQWAARSVAAGRYRAATEVLQAARYVSGGCNGMAGDQVKLPRENEGFSYMAFVAHAVVASMSRN